MTVLRKGSTEKYAQGWENVFGGRKKEADKTQTVKKTAASTKSPGGKNAPAKKGKKK